MQQTDEWNFSTIRIGRTVLVFDELASTSTTATELAGTGLADGSVILARHQTAGRGRLGRVWQSRPGGSLLMSVLMFPPPELLRASILTAWAAVAVGEAAYTLTGVQPRIKWPNDLLVRGKKVCGILIERGQGSGPNQPPSHVVTGIGLNLNQTAEEFAAAELPDAASLAIVGGKPIELRAATEAVVQRLDAEYARLLGDERTAVEADWAWRTGLLGRSVVIERTDGTVVVGRMRAMGFAGLEVEAEDGSVQVIVPEAVAHVRAV